MKTGKIIAFLLILLIPLAWWGFSHFNQSENPLPPLHTETVETGDVSQRVVAHGALQPVQKVTVGSQVSGIINDLYTLILTVWWNEGR